MLDGFFPRNYALRCLWNSVIPPRIRLDMYGDDSFVTAEASPGQRHFFEEDRDGDEQAAFAVAAWFQRADQDGSLESFFKPQLAAEE
jgi:hypothetical protein